MAEELAPDHLEPDNLDDGADEPEPLEHELPVKPEEEVPDVDEDEPGDEEVPEAEVLDSESAAGDDEVDDNEFDAG